MRNTPRTKQSLIERCDCGPVKLSGDTNPFYERHVTFDQVVVETETTARHKFEAIARSVRDVRSRFDRITLNKASVNSAEQIPIKKGSACIWLKSIVSRISRPALWTAGSAILVLLTLGGLYTIVSLDYEPPKSKFFLCFFLLLLFWIGWVALIVSFDCWVVFRIASVARARKIHRPETVRADAAGIIPCGTTSTDRKALPPTVSSLPTISA
jgi:hypothetical protein